MKIPVRFEGRRRDEEWEVFAIYEDWTPPFSPRQVFQYVLSGRNLPPEGRGPDCQWGGHNPPCKTTARYLLTLSTVTGKVVTEPMVHDFVDDFICRLPPEKDWIITREEVRAWMVSWLAGEIRILPDWIVAMEGVKR